MTLYIPLPGNIAMATELARLTGGEVGVLSVRRFPDEETYVRIESEVKEKHVDLVCTLARPDPHFARILSSFFERLVTVDPHLHRIHDLSEVFPISTRVVHAAPALADWIQRNVEKPLIVGPDSESEQWVSDVASRAGAPYLVLSKTRHGDRDVEIATPGLTDCVGRQPVLIDDIVSSGRTMIEAARHFQSTGFPKPVCVVVHAIFADRSYTTLETVASQVVSTDCVVHPSNQISLAPFLASASEQIRAR